MKIKKVMSAYSSLVLKFVIHLPTFIILLSGLYFIPYVLSNLDKNTTVITNTIFGILLVFSALFFTAAQLDDKLINYKKDLVFAGERLLHSGMMVMFVTILKYIFLQSSGNLVGYPITLIIVKLFLGLLIFLLLFQSFLMAHSGFILINKNLWARYPNHEKWDNTL